MVNVTAEDTENYAVGTDNEIAGNKFHDETINGGACYWRLSTHGNFSSMRRN
jgi:hypothetical protein